LLALALSPLELPLVLELATLELRLVPGLALALALE